MTTRLLPLIAAIALLGACEGSLSAYGDARGDDASMEERDATPSDAPFAPDARLPDAGMPDVPDMFIPDVGPADVGPADVGPADAPPAPVDASPPTPTCAFEGRTYALRHLQASMEHFDTAPQIRAAVDAAFDAGAHTISWTEIEVAAAANRIQARGGWDTYWPSGSADASRAKNAVPVSWRRDTFELVRGQSWMASAGRAGVSPSRWVTRVWLRHIATGLTQSRVAHHAVSGVDGAGKPPVTWRRMAHAQDIAKFREVMLMGSVPVVGSGDFNTTRLRTLLTGDFRFDVPSSGGSHGARLIDWIVRRPHRELAFMDARFVGLGPSDHRGVRATYEYRPRCP